MSLAFQNNNNNSTSESVETSWNSLLNIPYPTECQLINRNSYPQVSLINLIKNQAYVSETIPISKIESINESIMSKPEYEFQDLPQPPNPLNEVRSSFQHEYQQHINKSLLSNEAEAKQSFSVRESFEGPTIIELRQQARIVAQSQAPVAWTVDVSSDKKTTGPIIPPPLNSERSRSRQRTSRPESSSNQQQETLQVVETKSPLRKVEEKSSASQPVPVSKIDLIPLVAHRNNKSNTDADDVSMTSKISKDSQNTRREPQPTNIAINKPINSLYKPTNGSLWNTSVPIPVPIFNTTSPIRAISVLTRYEELDEIDIAVGTNARSVHVLRLPMSNYHYDSKVSVVKDFVDVHRGSIYAMDWCKELGLLATGSNDKAIRICK